MSLMHCKKPSHTHNTCQSAYTMPLRKRPAHSKATLGDRSFSLASSSVWNPLQNDVRCAPSLSSFFAISLVFTLNLTLPVILSLTLAVALNVTSALTFDMTLAVTLNITLLFALTLALPVALILKLY